jgi:5-methyltetrahydropteroyltriglutamate--homocysteine methyltransferase
MARLVVRENKLFPTSIVGSMPRTEEVRELLGNRSSLPPETYEARMTAAIREVVALQEQAGLDVVSDGEWRRLSYIGVIAELAHGFELSTHPEDGRPWTIVVDRLSPKEPGFIAQEATSLRSMTDRQIKVTLPSPALLGERMWDPERSGAAYPRREDFVADCVPILRREVELLQESGADIVQIDDPHLCLFVDPEVRSQHADPDAAAMSAVEAVNAVVEGITGPKLAVHLCRRAGARVRGDSRFSGGYEPILDQLNHLQVHHVTLEFTLPEVDSAVLSGLREDLEIGLGCLSVEPGKIDSVEVIVGRVERALTHVAPERITLNPDCGFAPGSGARVSLDEVSTKLQNEVRAAQVLRERHD